jgi:hypothetical protein
VNIVGGDRLKFQITRREICNNLRLGSHCAAWPYTNEIISVDAVKRRSISTNLCLNAFMIDLSYDLVDTLWSSSRTPFLPEADRGCCKNQNSYYEWFSHGELFLSNNGACVPRFVECLN